MQSRLPIFTETREEEAFQGLTCDLCPHYCQLHFGETGRCLVRKNIGKSIRLTQYGHCSVLSVEPIEKRPFFHFDPGKKYLAVGFRGCSFTCGFCQNYTLSQTSNGRVKVLTPLELVVLAKDKSTDGIAFTFNEPTVHLEYLLDVGAISSLPIVVKTNGFVNVDALRRLTSVVDAFNVDIKGDEHEYQTVCGGHLQPVIETINELYRLGKHLEISYLVTPRLLRDDLYHNRMLGWLEKMPEVPIHLLFFYPFHKMVDSYKIDELVPLVKIFKDRMKYVYLSNHYGSSVLSYRNTFCPDCGSLMIDRVRGVNISKVWCCGNLLTGHHD